MKIHNYTWSTELSEDISLIYYMIANVVREASGALFDHYLVAVKLRMKMKANGRIGYIHKRTNMVEVKEMIKEKELTIEICTS